MGRRAGGDPTGAINARTVAYTDYAPDPRGGSLMSRLGHAVVTTIDGGDGYVYEGDKGSGQHSFNGDYTASTLQGFTGAAALSLWGTVRPNTGGTLAEQAAIAAQDSLSDPGLRVFAARAARQGAWSM